jgi:hypothetical protein
MNQGLKSVRALVSQRFQIQTSFGAPTYNIFRAFAEVKGSFVDKKEVADRVLETVKKFDKVRAPGRDARPRKG